MFICQSSFYFPLQKLHVIQWIVICATFNAEPHHVPVPTFKHKKTRTREFMRSSEWIELISPSFESRALCHSIFSFYIFLYILFSTKKEGLIQCQTLTSNIRLKDEGWRMEEGEGWRMKYGGWMMKVVVLHNKDKMTWEGWWMRGEGNGTWVDPQFLLLTFSWYLTKFLPLQCTFLPLQNSSWGRCGQMSAS